MSPADGRVTKTFPVFDCDAHINDPYEIWTTYVAPEYRDLVRTAYWKDEKQALLNGRTPTIGGGHYEFPSYNPICIAGPQMSKQVMRKLQQTPLTAEQKRYLEHPGAYDPKARLKEMDLMGIDQVMIIPTMFVMNYPFIENVDAAYALARAYRCRTSRTRARSSSGSGGWTSAWRSSDRSTRAASTRTTSSRA